MEINKKNKLYSRINLQNLYILYKSCKQKGYFELSDVMTVFNFSREKSFFWINLLIKEKIIYKKFYKEHYVFFFINDMEDGK